MELFDNREGISSMIEIVCRPFEYHFVLAVCCPSEKSYMVKEDIYDADIM